MSGIYIKGMQAPKRDGVYRMGLVVKEGAFSVGIVKEEAFDVKNIDWFQCFPVPDHGRLIDADEQIERAWRLKLDTRELIAEMLESAPTVIPADKEEDKWYVSRGFVSGAESTLQQMSTT